METILMSSENTKDVLPPYVPFTTFSNFISSLAEHEVLPSHVDKSLMTKMSGSGQSAMTAALRSLRLVNEEFEPSELLEKLVKGGPDEFKKALAEVVKNTYGFLFEDGFNIENTTSKQVETKFKESTTASGSTLTKCISFFLSASSAADIKVSPHVKAPPAAKASGGRRKKIKQEPETEDPQKNEGIEPENPIPEMQNMTKFDIPLKDTENGVVLLPGDLNEQQAKKAVKMIEFILNQYYELED